MRNLFTGVLAGALTYAVFALSANALTILYPDGSVYEVKRSEKVVVVPKGTGRFLWTLGDKVKVKNPQPKSTAEPECAEEGELVIGPMVPCERTLSLGD